MNQSIIDYKANKLALAGFTDDQLFVFDFLVNSFPEKLLFNDPETTESIDEDGPISVLALMAYDIGSSRSLIENLKRSKDINYLFDHIGIGVDLLAENNEKLLLLNALDLSDVLFDDDMTVSQKLEIIRGSEERKGNGNFFRNAYSYIVNRGKLTTLNRVIADYLIDKIDVPEGSLDTISMDAKNFEVTDDGSGGKLVRIDEPVEEDIDLANDLSATFGVDYYGIKRKGNLSRIINSIRPAGVLYTIGMLYSANIIKNSDTPAVYGFFRLDSDLDLDGIGTVPSIVVDSFNYVESTGYMSYTITVTNPYKYTPVTLYVADFISPNYYTDQANAKTYASHHTVVLLPGETKTINLNTFYTYDPEGGTNDTAYIAGYFVGLNDLDAETDYNAVSVDTTINTPASGGTPTVTLTDPSLVTTKKSSQAGGYVELQVGNLNSVAVTAHIDWTYTSGGSTDVRSKTIIISSESNKIENLYNPFESTADVDIDVYLTAPGYDDSSVVSAQVTGVERTYLGQ